MRGERDAKECRDGDKESKGRRRGGRGGGYITLMKSQQIITRRTINKDIKIQIGVSARHICCFSRWLINGSKLRGRGCQRTRH